MLISVKGAYLDLIRAGRKSSTIRYWQTCRLQPGSLLTFTNYRDTVHARCTAVDCVPANQLTEQDAQADGFATVDELRQALRTHYPTLTDQTHVWVIHFTTTEREAHSGSNASS